MSRPVQIVVTLVLFTAVMVGLNAVLRPVIDAFIDGPGRQMGAVWLWVLILVTIVPFGLWGWWHTYREGKAARTRSD